MKTASKHFKLASVATVLSVIAMSLATAPVLAVDATSTSGSATTTGVCKNAATLGSNAINAITNSVAKLTVARQAQDKDMATHRATWLSDVQAARTKDASDRQAQYAKLESKATTGAEKTAVQTYEQTINTAVATRIAAHDASRTAYFIGVDAVVSGHRSAVDAQIATFKGAVTSAVSAAQASCAAGTPATTVRGTFVAALKQARENFKAARQVDAKEATAIKALNDTRLAANQQADQTFKATASAAATALKQAFGSHSSNV